MSQRRIYIAIILTLVLSLGAACSGREGEGGDDNQRPVTGGAAKSPTTPAAPAAQPNAQRKLYLVFIRNDKDEKFKLVRTKLLDFATKNFLTPVALNVTDEEQAKQASVTAAKYNLLKFFADSKNIPASAAILPEGGDPEFVSADLPEDRFVESYEAALSDALRTVRARVPETNDTARGAFTPAQEKELTDRLNELNGRVKTLEERGNGQGLFESLGTPLGLLGLAALSLLSLGLAAASFLLLLRVKDNSIKLKQDFYNFKKASQKDAAAQTPAPQQAQAARSAAPSDGQVEQLSQQVRDQQQAIAHLTQQLGTLESRAAAGEKRTSDSLQAVEQVTRWLTRMHMRGAEGDVYEDESERTAALSGLERNSERLRANATIVEPLTQAIADLVETLEARPSTSSELLARVQRLYHDIGQFDQWAVTCEAQLNALRRGSMDERRVKFHSEQKQLVEQLKAGRISVAQYIEQFSRLLEHHFPPGAQNGGGAQTPVAHLSEEQLRQYIDGAPEYLMDWFSSFSQLQSQAQAAQQTGAGVDAETVEALASVQRAARDVLSRFDIQPEEIYVGRTNYDRHLHEAAMIRQTTQFPVNTVIEVHRAGFRRVSTGEVLRRPQVIVAGAGA